MKYQLNQDCRKLDRKKIKNKEKVINLPFRSATGKPLIDDFAGLWEQNPKTIEQIREKAWKRNL